MILIYNGTSKNGYTYVVDALVVETEDESEYSFDISGDNDISGPGLTGRCKGEINLNWIMRNGDEVNIPNQSSKKYQKLLNESLLNIRDHGYYFKFIVHPINLSSEEYTNWEHDNTEECKGLAELHWNDNKNEYTKKFKFFSAEE